jgi:hypothetical protein
MQGHNLKMILVTKKKIEKKYLQMKQKSKPMSSSRKPRKLFFRL